MILRAVFFIIYFFLYNYNLKAQLNIGIDTSIVCSITIYNKSVKKEKANFPDVYPKISKLYFIENESSNDTMFCSYNFPFLELSKAHLERIKKSKNVTLHFFYDYVSRGINNRYLISVPIKFSFGYVGAKFIVIEHFKRNRFFGMQKWGSTIYVGELLKSSIVY